MLRTPRCIHRLICVVLSALSWAIAPVDTLAQTSPQTPPAALAPAALKALTVRGLSDAPASIKLIEGVWQGRPYAPGGAERPEVMLMPRPIVWGDLDRDGRAEAVVLLSQRTGGSGEFLHIGVVSARGGPPRTIATRLVGDRVQVRDVRLQDGSVWLDVVRAGAQDAACCPGEVASLGWRLDRGRLVPLSGGPAPTRLGPAVVGSDIWVLRQWKAGEPTAPQPEVSLSHQDGRFVGHSGCNRYMAAVLPRGDTPGDLQVSPPAGTRMACEAAAGAVEGQYLEQLSRVRRMRFQQGQLALDYEVPGEGLLRTMLFERAASR